MNEQHTTSYICPKCNEEIHSEPRLTLSGKESEEKIVKHLWEHYVTPKVEGLKEELEEQFKGCSVDGDCIHHKKLLMPAIEKWLSAKEKQK